MHTPDLGCLFTVSFLYVGFWEGKDQPSNGFSKQSRAYSWEGAMFVICVSIADLEVGVWNYWKDSRWRDVRRLYSRANL